MTKQTNYIVTVTDVNQMLPPITTNPTNSNRAVIKDEVGQTAGSVGVVNNWQVDTTAVPFNSYTSNRLPRFQDLVYEIYYCGDPTVINGYDGLDFYLYPNVTVDSSVTTQVYFNWTSYDRPNRFDVYDSVGLRYTTGWVGQATYPGPWGSSLNTATTGSQLFTWLSTSGRYVSVAAGPADPSAPISDTNTWNLTCITPTTTTTTSTTSTTTTMVPYQSYDLYYPCGTTIPADQRAAYTGNQSPGEIILGSNNLCYTIVGPTIAGPPQITIVSEHSTCQDCEASRATTTTTTTCNPTPNWQNTGIYNCYSTCNLYYEQQDINPCSPTYGQTRQGPLYQTDSTSCGGCCGQPTTPTWVSNGAAYCDSCVSKQPQIDNGPCSPTSGQTRVINSGSACNTTQSWVNSGSYNCYSTCNKYNVEIQNNPCASGYNTTRQGSLVESNSTFCGGCCGQSTAATWVNTGSYSCYSTCNKYNVEQDNNICSPTYGQTQQGTLVESNSTFCGGCCGVSPAANWVNNGATFCTGCTLYQPQIDNNVCSSTYGNTRNVNLGTNDSCGSWPTAYYCIGCAYYSHEVNSCTGNVRNTILISSDSTSCGGCCGQSTAATWTNEGSAYCESCVSKQLQRDTNPCSPTYNQTRVINSGSACNTSANWVNSGSYDCYGSCTKYNVEVDNNPCSSTYNQTRQGSVVEYNSTFCGGCCGQSTSPNWVDNGATFCDGCNLQQPQIDSNPCSATYGDTRNIDLGVTNACGVWVQSFYCVGYTKWTKETNTCTGNIRNESVVEYDSPYCGYVPPPTCRTYQIVGYNADEYVDGTYTNCAGFPDSFSFYGGPGTVGTVCAQISSVYITSGNGAANDIGGC